jgi:hypothetical protein
VATRLCRVEPATTGGLMTFGRRSRRQHGAAQPVFVVGEKIFWIDTAVADPYLVILSVWNSNSNE